MLVAERYERIVQLVNERGSIRVTELSEICGVTEETIRRDLDRLEHSGRLRRSHGGAVSIKDQLSPGRSQPETPFTEREVANAAEKQRIAEEAVKLIEPHQKILLDASTTAWYMARLIPDFPLTVLTNSIKAAAELGGKEKIEVISTGGIMAHRSLSFVGPLAERSLESYYVDQAFLSFKGVHLERGLSESNELQARVKHKMVHIAEQVVLLADASKFGVQAFKQVADLSCVNKLITDNRLEAHEHQIYRQLGIEVITV
ncbi:DeoR/GlpR family DNA-binding transcription regulator [Paenibacillus lemnae]|uniref:DeoR/GlpR transcriptional regulator n=1 Tax=Paenibacillus lemnae TaxID=1330551 RepID=A0A848MCM6_PAELE|nr:DeoR/GlpR family DNA-binding transcription regulator [Paenibacillus lemnae]NMO97813.1 DeoR/GlpR transcriptional regulator [Paenibacillus lemnae]